MDIARRCFRVDANLRPEGRDGPLARSRRQLRGLLGPVGPAVGVPGPAQGRARRRRPPTSGADVGVGRVGRACGAGPSRRRPPLAAVAEGPGRGRGRAQGPHRPRGEAGAGRHPRHRVRGAAPPARARPLGPRAAVARPRSAPWPSWRPAATSTGDDADGLADAYRFLRRVEHRLQLEDEQQVHTLPADRDQRRRHRPGARLPGQPRGRAHRGVRRGAAPGGATGALDPRAPLLPPAARRARRAPAAMSPEAAAERAGRLRLHRRRAHPAGGAGADPRPHPVVAADAADAAAAARTGCRRPPIPTSGCSACATWPRASSGSPELAARLPGVARRRPGGCACCSAPAGCSARSCVRQPRPHPAGWRDPGRLRPVDRDAARRLGPRRAGLAGRPRRAPARRCGAGSDRHLLRHRAPATCSARPTRRRWAAT